MAADGTDVQRKCWSCKISRFLTHEKARNLVRNLFRALAGHCLSRPETQLPMEHPLTQTGFLADPKVVLHRLPRAQGSGAREFRRSPRRASRKPKSGSP